MGKISKKKKRVKSFLGCLLFLIICWFSFTLYDVYRVKTGKSPTICFHIVKDIESPEEYSKTCFGLLIKYREYYLRKNDKLNAKEYTLIWKEFKREVSKYEIG